MIKDRWHYLFISMFTLDTNTMLSWKPSNVPNLPQIQIYRILSAHPQLLFQSSNHSEIFHRAWQSHCHALCKISKWLDDWDECFSLDITEFKLALRPRFPPECNNPHFSLHSSRLSQHHCPHRNTVRQNPHLNTPPAMHITQRYFHNLCWALITKYK